MGYHSTPPPCTLSLASAWDLTSQKSGSPLPNTAVITRRGEGLEPTSRQPEGRWLSVVTHLDPRFGGLSAVVPQLSSMVAASGRFSVSLAAFCSPGELYSAANHAELSLTEWPTSRLTWLRDRSLATRLDQLVRSASGVHIHGLWEQSTAVAARAARSAGVPYILSAHGMLERWALANKRFKKAFYSFLVERANVEGAACVHALTRAEAEDYLRYGCHVPIAVIPNGVHVPNRVSQDLFFAQHPSLRGKRIVLFLGRIHFKKGLDLLVRAWAKIAARWPDAHLVLAGPDFEGTRARVSRMIEEAGLGDSILLPGMLRNELKWSALAAAECFVLPSYSEGLSVAALEAMGVGLPVILTDHCNLPEVQSLGAGWIIPADAMSLEQALSECLGNHPTTNQAIGARGSSFVRERYTWSNVASQMGELYGWVQGGGPAPAGVEFFQSRGAL